MRQQQLATIFVEIADTLVDDFDVIEFLQLLADRSVSVVEVSAAGKTRSVPYFANAMDVKLTESYGQV